MKTQKRYPIFSDNDVNSSRLHTMELGRLAQNVGFRAACYRKFLHRKRYSAARMVQSDTTNDDIKVIV